MESDSDSYDSSNIVSSSPSPSPSPSTAFSETDKETSGTASTLYKRPSSGFGAHPRQRKARAPKMPPPPRQTAKVEALAEQEILAGTETTVDARILDRIRKCLDRANHPTTPEMEAKAALSMSSRLMAQYNVSHADVLAQATTSEEQARLGGQSSVAIRPTKSDWAKVIMQTWVGRVSDAMETFFDVKSYSTQYDHKIVWTFYGIPQNTVASAISFEMAHNLTLEWARDKKGKINDYCNGVGAGLEEMAREEKRKEKHQAMKKEKEALAARLEQERLQRQKELDRLNGHAADVEGDGSKMPQVEEETVIPDQQDNEGEASDEDEDEYSPAPIAFDDSGVDDADDMVARPTFKQENEAPLDLSADFEEELQKIIKQERSPTPDLAEVPAAQPNLPKQEEDEVKSGIKNEDEEQQTIGELSAWTSSQQLTLFHKSAMNVADEYLKATKIKLKQGRKRSYSMRDWAAFEAGKRDSRNIDVRRRRLE